MPERNIPRKARILGEVTLVIAGGATFIAGGFITHNQTEKSSQIQTQTQQNKDFLNKNNKAGFPMGINVMLVGSSLALLGAGALAREEHK